MPSHIFAQLGMWQPMIDSNLAAAASAAEAARKDKNNGAEYQLHPMHYLSYAYLQTGRDDEAQKLADSLKDVPAIQPDEITDEGGAMRALAVMETHRWNMAAQLDEKAPTVAFVRMRVHWARAISAAHLGDRKTARQNVKQLHRDYAALRKERGILRESSPMVTEAEAWLEFARGKAEKAFSKMRAAADQDEFGVDEFSLPAREQLGDLLLELKRPAEALEAYETMLKTAPGRFDSLWGAGHAAELAGKPEIAARYYAQLLKTAAPSSDRAERKLAITFLENTRSTGSLPARD
jgi:tetratricopeptide (TPR) repeat protein